MLTDGLKQAIEWFCNLFPAGTFFNTTFMVQGLLAVILVGVVCGAVGSLVVGNRMAFFSDALAHTAFAGVTLGLLTGLLLGAPRNDDFYEYGITVIMVVFGILVGLAIAFVREKTGLSSDTVIGVFFAGAMGFGAVLLHPLGQISFYNVDDFLFGYPCAARPGHLLVLILLTMLTLGLLLVMYNDLVFTSFNPSLARSRNIPMRLYNYLFIALLALIVNLSLRIVGALLINAMLIVPAATAANLCRNLRQLFWTTIGLSVLVGIAGELLSFHVPIYIHGRELHLGEGGLVVVLSVLLFFASMLVGPWLRNRARAPLVPEAK